MSAITPAIRPAIGPAIRSAFDGGFTPSLLAQAMRITRTYGGALYAPSVLSSLYQDAAGTLPVTAPGQPVGLMRDLSGNGHHVSQTTTTARPLYQIIDGYPCVVGDGVDDLLRTPVQIPAGPDRSTTLMVGARLLSESADYRVVAGAESVTPQRQVRIQRDIAAIARNAAFVNYGVNAYALQAASTPLGITSVMSVVSKPDTPKVELFINCTSAAVNLNNPGASANGPMTLALLARGAGGGSNSNSAIFAAVYLPVAATPAEQLVLTRFLASRSGVTL